MQHIHICLHKFILFAFNLKEYKFRGYRKNQLHSCCVYGNAVTWMCVAGRQIFDPELSSLQVNRKTDATFWIVYGKVLLWKCVAPEHYKFFYFVAFFGVVPALRIF